MNIIEACTAGGPAGTICPIIVGANKHVLTGSWNGRCSKPQLLKRVVFITLKQIVIGLIVTVMVPTLWSFITIASIRFLMLMTAIQTHICKVLSTLVKDNINYY